MGGVSSTFAEDEDLVQMKLRVPEFMHRRLRAVAAANRRTLNGEVVHRLERSLRELGSDEEIAAILGSLASPEVQP